MIVASQMDTFSLDCGTVPASVLVSRFHGDNGVDECHLTVRPTEYGAIEDQLSWMFRAYQDALDTLGLDAQSAVFRRFLCSDLVNQAAALEGRPLSDPLATDNPCAISWTEQPPLAPAKAAMWAYHIHDPEAPLHKTRSGDALSLHRGQLVHHWTTQETSPNNDSPYAQTKDILERYDAFLRAHGMTVADNLVRTWFFVQNIDADYQGLVTARREFFGARGLTRETHFVASTGIQGAYANTAAKVMLDAYAVSGMQTGQVAFLSAPSHLCPAKQYGVTFERGTSIAYRDRKHIMISGTASIDKQGKIVYPGDISRQLNRTLENIEALLKSAGAALHDMVVFVVYVRDPSDAALVDAHMKERFGDTPTLLVTAPVCRPGWLVEVEGMAIIPTSNPNLPPL